MVPICCLVGLVSESGGKCLRVFATTVSAFTGTNDQTGETCPFRTVMQLVWLNVWPLHPQHRWRSACGGILQSGCSWMQLRAHMRFPSIACKVFEVSGEVVGWGNVVLRPKIRLLLWIFRGVFQMWRFGVLIWKENHLLIDWCLFWNKAADWFPQGLINIYVSFNCFLFGYVSARTVEHPSQRFNQDEDIFCCCPQRLNQIIYFKEGQIPHNCILIMFMFRQLQEGDSVTLSSNAAKEAFKSGQFHRVKCTSSLIKAFWKVPLVNHQRLLSTFCSGRRACSTARRQVAPESREAPAADVCGSNTSQDCRFLPAPSLCHLTGRPEFRGEESHCGVSISEDTDELRGFRSRSVIYCNYVQEEVSFSSRVKAENESSWCSTKQNQLGMLGRF